LPAAPADAVPAAAGAAEREPERGQSGQAAGELGQAAQVGGGEARAPAEACDPDCERVRGPCGRQLAGEQCAFGAAAFAGGQGCGRGEVPRASGGFDPFGDPLSGECLRSAFCACGCGCGGDGKLRSISVGSLR